MNFNGINIDGIQFINWGITVISVIVGAVIGSVITWKATAKVSRDQIKIQLQLKTLNKLNDIFEKLYYSIRDVYNSSGNCLIYILNYVEHGNAIDSERFSEDYNRIYEYLHKLEFLMSDLYKILENDRVIIKLQAEKYLKENKLNTYVDLIQTYCSNLLEMKRKINIRETMDIESMYKESRELLHKKIIPLKFEIIEFNQNSKKALEKEILGHIFR